ncbi:MAG: hypothetical protein GXP25_07845 [Planctomycetes bacterium]|nr:hypothetical protein [Planctomycetota bacterium]
MKKCLTPAILLLVLCGGAWPADDPSRYIALLDVRKLAPAGADDAAVELALRYYACVSDWGRILSARYRPYQKIPGAGYYGGTANEERDIRAACYAVLVNAFLTAIDPPDLDVTEEGREEDAAAMQAVHVLRYLCATHQTADKPCPEEKPWGAQPGSAMGAKSMGLGAWLIWDRLDSKTRTAVARIIEYEADRLLGPQPLEQSSARTKAEVNAGNAQVLSLAANMMPDHPHAKQWDRQAKFTMYNALSSEADRRDQGIGDDGTPVCDWVKTVNLLPDYTIQNNGYVHLRHMSAAVTALGENCLPYLLAGKTPPQATLHNVAKCYRAYRYFMAWDGSPVYVTGSDWKMIHTQAADVFAHAFCCVMLDDNHAAYLEMRALDFAERMQDHCRGYYNVDADPAFNGMCASALIHCYLLHALRGPGPKPIDSTRFNLDATGTKKFDSAKLIIHRTPGKFASFSWGAKRLALAIPSSGNWTIWPHPASYIGLINGEPPDEEHSTLVKCNVKALEHGFTATCRLSRVKGKVDHYVSFASLPNDVVVYTDLRVAAEDVEIAGQQIGLIGVEYPLDKNERDLYTVGMKLTVRGVNLAQDQKHRLQSPWLNLDNYVGYVVIETMGKSGNEMLYFNQAHASGQIPKLEEWVALHNISRRTSYRKGEQIGSVCIITFLNQPWRRTRRARDTAGGSLVSDKFLFCIVGSHTVAVNFGEKEMTLDAPIFGDVVVPPFSTIIKTRDAEF